MRLKPASSQLFIPRAIMCEPSAVLLVARDRLSDDAVLRDTLSALGAEEVSTVECHVAQLRKRQAGVYDWSAEYPRDVRWGWFDLANFFQLPAHHSEVRGVNVEWTLDVFNPENRECRFPFHDPNVCGLTLTVNPLTLTEGSEDQGMRWVCRSQLYFRELLKRVIPVLQPQFAFGGGICNFALSFYFGKKRMPVNVDFKSFHWGRALYTAADWKALGLSDRWDAGPEKVVPVPTFGLGNPFREAFPLTLYREDLPGGYVYVYSNSESYDEGTLCGDALGLPYACANPLKELP